MDICIAAAHFVSQRYATNTATKDIKMTNLTQQIVLKISPELNSLLDKAFEKSVQETGNPPTRSDYVRSILEKHCVSELKQYKSVANFYVKDELLNKVIWTLLCRIYQGSLPQQNPFRALHLTDFVVGARIGVEEIFYYLKDRGIVDLDKDNNGSLSLRLRVAPLQEAMQSVYYNNIQELKNIASDNIVYSNEMLNFIKMIKLWNKPENKYSVGDMCMFSFHLPQAKPNLSNNGFIITKDSSTLIPNEWFVRDVLNDSPSEYARQLWDISRKGDEHENELYITYPDIYIGQK